MGEKLQGIVEPMQFGGVKEKHQGTIVYALWNENEKKTMADCLTKNVEAIKKIKYRHDNKCREVK